MAVSPYFTLPLSAQPERINLSSGYDSRSDIWSFGITIIEVATGRFPYPKWNSVFEQVQHVVMGASPSLPKNDEKMKFSESFVSFIEACLQKDVDRRPKYPQLMVSFHLYLLKLNKEMEFFQKSRKANVDVSSFFCKVLDFVPQTTTIRDFVEENCADIYYA
ncbi:Dual specificity mitogen-activated protein kinase kinase 4 [Cichlidogyrus casuarinus]|uniref:mitogen-activated protein kinase kinase n=1 Tax=Cichlidogyrus casuarinus TaxID=1844966 RepID=A0ABD2QD45_9PLAT